MWIKVGKSIRMCRAVWCVQEMTSLDSYEPLKTGKDNTDNTNHHITISIILHHIYCSLILIVILFIMPSPICRLPATEYYLSGLTLSFSYSLLNLQPFIRILNSFYTNPSALLCECRA